MEQFTRKDLGLNLIEFSKVMSCCRCNYLDKTNFYYFDGRDFSEEYETLTKEIIISEVA